MIDMYIRTLIYFVLSLYLRIHKTTLGMFFQNTYLVLVLYFYEGLSNEPGRAGDCILDFVTCLFHCNMILPVSWEAKSAHITWDLWVNTWFRIKYTQLKPAPNRSQQHKAAWPSWFSLLEYGKRMSYLLDS